MRNRLTKIAAGLAALAALALGGSAIAGAGGKDNTPPAPPATSQVQEPSSAVDADNVQQGDQTSPDTENAKTESESAASEQPGNDGPGGHADEPANANADHQFEGQE